MYKINSHRLSPSIVLVSAVALEQSVLRKQLKANVCQMSVSF
ncbi:hypothetical protein FORMA_10450 [Formosa sp. Hel3_A1_48]|jgi:hypothetical protein|nr:hypothetical protein FORMA_10450 [Formosa sp. Hel3_A1_48]